MLTTFARNSVKQSLKHPVSPWFRILFYHLTVCIDVRRQLQKRLQEDDLSASTSSVAQSGLSTRHPFSNSGALMQEYIEMRAIIESYKEKEQANQERFEAAEIERAKAARAEAFGLFKSSLVQFVLMMFLQFVVL